MDNQLSTEPIQESSLSSKTKKTPEEKAKEIEEEKRNLLSNLYSGQIMDIKDRVALILNSNIDARNSDIELAWAYWQSFHSELFDGVTLTKDLFLQLPKISSLCRLRAKIQNEYNLFLADPKVRQYRGKLEEEYKDKAVADRAPNLKSYTVYIDETGKNQDYLSIGSIWLPSYNPSIIRNIMEIQTWKKQSKIEYEFHFSQLSSHKLDQYKGFIRQFLPRFPEASFKTIIIKNHGVKDKDAIIQDLTYYLIKKGIEHENNSGRAPLPRGLNVTIDDENPANDILKLEAIKDKLTAQRIDGLELGQFSAVSSEGNLFIQLIDLFTGSINRKLNSPNGNGHKDELATFILETIGLDLDDFLNDQGAGDNAKIFDFTLGN